MPDCIPTLEAAPVVCFADHTAGVATHGATVGLSGCVARARQRAGQIKASPAYTTATGEDSRIVAPSGGGGDGSGVETACLAQPCTAV